MFFTQTYTTPDVIPEIKESENFIREDENCVNGFNTPFLYFQLFNPL